MTKDEDDIKAMVAGWIKLPEEKKILVRYEFPAFAGLMDSLVDEDIPDGSLILDSTSVQEPPC